MNSPNDIIRKRLEVILAGAEDLDGDSIIIKVDSPPLVDGFQPIGSTDVDEKAVAIIGNYLGSQKDCITSRGISWKVSSYEQNRIEINRIRPKPTPKKPDDADKLMKDDVDASNIIEISNKIISGGLEGGAKEILIQPSGNQIDVLFRIGGSWINFDYDLNPRLWNALLTRIKILAQMDISETSISQKGLILVTTDKGVDYKIDVSIRPAAEGSAITMRIKEHSYEKYIAAALSEDTAEGGPSFRKDSIAQIREGINSETETHRILPVEDRVGFLQLFLGTSIVIFGGFCLIIFLMVTFGGDEPSGFDSESFQAKTPTPVIQPTSSDSLANPSEGTSAKPDSSPLPVDSEQAVLEKFKRAAAAYMKQAKAQARRITWEKSAGNEYASGTNSIRQGQQELARITGSRVPNTKIEAFYRVVGYFDIQSDYTIDVKKNDSIISPYVGTIYTKRLCIPTKVVECEPPNLRNLVMAKFMEYEKWEPLVIECSYQNGKWTSGKNLKQTLER